MKASKGFFLNNKIIFLFYFWKKKLQWNSFIKATQNGGLSKEVACHEG